MDIKQIKHQKFINLVQMISLFAAMTALLSTTGWVLAGLGGVKIALILACLSWLFSPSLPSKLVMRMYRARPIYPRLSPGLYQISDVLAKRAGLKRAPVLYLMPGQSFNAFAAGSQDDPAICISQGLIHTLDTREIAGILGHEITHIKNNDVQVMGYAGLFSRITYYISLVGQIGLIFYIPIAWVTGGDLSLLAVMIVAFAPVISFLLNQALSRTREYAADLGSAMLTGNPDYLTSALAKLEQYQKNLKRWLGMPLTLNPQASLLSTHPPTTERIRRLQSYKTGHPDILWAGQ